MGIICTLFGHAPLTYSGWHGDTGYADVRWSQRDGMGTEHLVLSAKCPRCGDDYRICNVHVPKWILDDYKK